MQIQMFLPTVFFFVLIWRDEKAFQFSEFQHRYKLLFRKTHVHISTPLFNPTNFCRKKNTYRVDHLWCNSETNFSILLKSRIPLWMKCLSKCLHFQFFFSLCSLSQIKLKLIHSVRCMWMWGGKCSSKKWQKTELQKQQLMVILEIYAITTETETHINYWALHHIEWAVAVH